MALTYALITVTEAKTYLGLSGSTYDTVLDALVDGVTVWVENYLGGRRLSNAAAADITEYHDGPPVTSMARRDDKKRIYPRRYPLVSVTSIAYRSSSDYQNPTFTNFSAQYEYILESDKGSIYFPGGLPPGVQNIKLIYQGGYATASMPEDVKLAVKMMVAKAFGKRKVQGITAESVGGGSLTWSEETSPEVLSILNSYRAYHV